MLHWEWYFKDKKRVSRSLCCKSRMNSWPYEVKWLIFLTAFSWYAEIFSLFSSNKDSLQFISLHQNMKNKGLGKHSSHFAKLTHTDTCAMSRHASAACVYRWWKPLEKESNQKKKHWIETEKVTEKQESKSKYESYQESRNLCLPSNNKAYRGNERGRVHDMHVDLEICLHLIIIKSVLKLSTANNETQERNRWTNRIYTITTHWTDKICCNWLKQQQFFLKFFGGYTTAPLTNKEREKTKPYR